MQATKKNLSDTKVQLTLKADAEVLAAVKKEVLTELAKTVKLQGFRAGHAPLALVEKNVDPARLQSDFLDHALNELYVAALDEHKLQPVSRPEVTISKFVPFDTLEAEMTVDVVGEVTLPDYKKMKRPMKAVTTTAKEIDAVIDDLLAREAEKKDVDRASKDGDQVWIDFVGTDAKTKEPINGGEGKNYPLTLGSNTFIPGFEANLVGLKAGEEKSFTLTFPKDYGVKALQSRKVTFAVTVLKVQEVVKPKVDDTFAAKVGPFKTVADLKADIKKQLQVEKEAQSERAYVDDLITDITKESKVALPDVLVDEQVDRLVEDQRRNLMYRGQTWQEFLEAEGSDEAGYRKQIRPDAELRVKAGIVLAEIAEKEKITVTPEELTIRMQLLKGQYQDAAMQAELDKPSARRDIASRMMSEKTVDKLKEYASAK